MSSYFMEFFSLLISSGLLGYLFFYQSKKRKESAAASALELQNANFILEQKNEYIHDLKNEMTELKVEIKEARSNEAKERDKVVLLYKQLSNVNVKNVKVTEQLVISRFHRCEELNCVKRKPAREFVEVENL